MFTCNVRKRKDFVVNIACGVIVWNSFNNFRQSKVAHIVKLLASMSEIVDTIITPVCGNIKRMKNVF